MEFAAHCADGYHASRVTERIESAQERSVALKSIVCSEKRFFASS